MLYIKSYFKKEMQQSYQENNLGRLRKIAYALFLGLFSFAVFFLLQTMAKTVLSDALPHIMQASYFSTLSLYNITAYLGFMAYFIVNYDAMSFAEIRKNRWYMLIKMGYEPYPMIFSKIVALLLSLLFVYSAGFAFIVVLTVFLKFTFIFGYLPTLYIAGLLDLWVFSMAFMAISLIAKNTTNGRYLILLAAVGQLLLKYVTGFHAVMVNRVAMQHVYALLELGKSVYVPIALLLIAAFFVLCLVRAKSLSQSYSLPYEMYGYTMPDDAKVVHLRGKNNRPVSLNIQDIAMHRSRMLNAVVIALLVLLIVASLLFNFLIILMSTSQGGKEAVIAGKIPYIFESNTMEPAIMENDLAFFTKIDAQAPIHVGDVVLFTSNNAVFVERVTRINGSTIDVDIDYYPPMAQKGAMQKTIDRSEVYGTYAFASRWLGAIILFANSVFGRILLLVIPAVLLFFNRPIKAFFDRRRRSIDDPFE